MNAILQRLQAKLLPLPSTFTASGHWHFQQQLRAQNADFFRSLLPECYALNIEYESLCARLTDNIRQTGDRKHHTELLVTALMMAELLDVVSQDFHYVFRDKKQLQHDKHIFYRWLQSLDYSVPQEIDTATPDGIIHGIEKTIREKTLSWNIARVLSQRGRRLLATLSLYCSHTTAFGQWIQRIDRLAHPLIAHLTWLFFLPRLLANLTSAAKHLMLGSGMAQNEKNLGYGTHLYLLCERHGFDVGIDLGWVVVGLLNCYVFTGPLALYLSIGLQAFDMALLSSKAYCRLAPLQQTLAQYRELLQEPARPASDTAEIALHIVYLQKRIDYERKKLYLGISSSSVILFSLILALPALALHPLLPLAGALLAVSCTLVFYSIDVQLGKSKPSPQLCVVENTAPSTPLRQLGFFSSPTLITTANIVQTPLRQTTTKGPS
ncbi:MAG: hypothetical protein JJT82_08700 [Legionellaceae bacterium]|nr:hypothetical protein [Legionellaceae bacterium]